VGEARVARREGEARGRGERVVTDTAGLLRGPRDR